MGMQPSQKKALSVHRRRQKRRGITRLEVSVRNEDVALVRGVVDALADPERSSETRALLRERVGARGVSGLKALLASAPLDGVDLTRSRETGRIVDL
jgi:hypothetical protein